jgi:hypothetical protein
MKSQKPHDKSVKPYIALTVLSFILFLPMILKSNEDLINSKEMPASNLILMDKVFIRTEDGGDEFEAHIFDVKDGRCLRDSETGFLSCWNKK